MDIRKEFIDEEHPHKQYPVTLGRHVATALSGFIAGVVLTSIVWALAIYLNWLFNR